MVNGCAQTVQIVAEMVDDAQHGIPVGKKDVMPHHRVTCSNAGEVPEATGCVAKNIKIFILPRQGIHQ